MLFCGLIMMELQSKERFGRQSGGLSIPFTSLQASSCLVLCKRLALLIRIWLEGSLLGLATCKLWWREHSSSEQSKGLTGNIGGMETQSVLTGLVRRPAAYPVFLLQYILFFTSETVSGLRWESHCLWQRWLGHVCYRTDSFLTVTLCRMKWVMFGRHRLRNSWWKCQKESSWSLVN